MSLIQFVPTYLTLSPQSFKDNKEREGLKTLVLGSSHSVFSSLGGESVAGDSNIYYVIDAPLKAVPLSENLVIKKNLSLIGYQSAEELRGLLEAVRVRQSYSLASVGDSSFDLRALCYVTGAVCATVTSGCDYDFSQHTPCRVRLLSPTWTIPTVTDLTIAPGIATTGKEFATLARMCGASGVMSITLMSDVVPPQTHKTLQGLELGVFCLKLFSTLINSAQSCACASMHVQAFFAGMNHHLTLRSHTDEGGWIRSALKSAEYPPSVGIITVSGNSFMGVSANQKLNPSFVPQVVLGIFLELVGTLVTSDPESGDGVTILAKDGGGNSPSDFSTLRDAYYHALSRFRGALCKDYDLHVSTVGDDSSSDPYWRSDQPDRHFEASVIVPFYWVEPGPLTTRAREYPNVMVQGKSVELPLMSVDATFKSVGYQEHAGRAVRGGASYLRSKGCNPRLDGCSYLMSQRYRRENGLAYMEAVTNSAVGVVTTDALFVEEGVTIMSERGWVTPHNPVRSPGEGRTSLPFLTKYTYRGHHGEPNHDDWATATVHSYVSPLFVVDHGPQLPKKHVVTHASKQSLAWARNQGRYIPAKLYDMASFPPDVIEPVEYPEPQPATPENATSEGCDTQIETEDQNPPSAEGIDTTLTISGDSGMRVRLPDVQLETKDPVGEGSV
jgi:hypothetical protein